MCSVIDLVFDVAEDCHPDDCVDEGDEGQQGPDVEQGRQRHDQRKQQLTDTLGGLIQFYLEYF